jgi:hypothetical protein
MSNPTTLAAKTIPMAFSTDNITWKSAVCLKTGDVSMSIPTTDEETQCGRLRSEAVQDVQFTFDIVANTTPNGATEISAATLLGYFTARTPVYVKIAPGTGMNISAYGKIYEMKTQVTGAANLISFSGTFKADGDATIS